MIFKRELIGAILAGRKTQTRRPVKKGEAKCRYKVGRSYAIQSGRGKPSLARMTVTDVVQEQLHEISEKDAKREGFPDREAFFAYWRQLYGTGPLLEVSVWVISFVLDTREPDRFLGQKGGYVEQVPGSSIVPMGALQGIPGGEPQAVDAATQEQFTAEGWERFAARQPALEERLAAVRREAQEKGVEAHRIEASIERRVKAYERLVRAA